MDSITRLVEKSYTTAKEKGWWDDTNIGTLQNPNEVEVLSKIALIHSELSEALETVREGNTFPYIEFGKKEGLGVELADACIRIFDLCGALNIDLEQEIYQKMNFNKTRPFKHGKKI